jgi:hypothetical protein
MMLVYFVNGLAASVVLLLVWFLLSPILALGGFIERGGSHGETRFDVFFGTILWLTIGLLTTFTGLGYLVTTVFGL